MCVLPGQSEESSPTSRGLKFSSKSNFTRRCNWRNDVRVPRRTPILCGTTDGRSDALGIEQPTRITA
jgi:hypothetical protein